MYTAQFLIKFPALYCKLQVHESKVYGYAADAININYWVQPIHLIKHQGFKRYFINYLFLYII